jgi:hypothetical protein
MSPQALPNLFGHVLRKLSLPTDLLFSELTPIQINFLSIIYVIILNVSTYFILKKAVLTQIRYLILGMVSGGMSRMTLPLAQKPRTFVPL